MTDLGLILKNLRIEHGYLQKQVAQKMGVSVSTIGRWESNLKHPSVERLIRLAQLYNVSLNYLVGLDSERAITLSGLPKSQKWILKQLVKELNDNPSVGLTDDRLKLIGCLLKEFLK